MKALMFGGAFNPPTRAHIELADYARKKINYDTVIFVPTKLKYIEEDQGKDFAFSDSQRLTMLKKISATHPWMVVSDFEINSLEQPRTYTTLSHLRQSNQYEEIRLLFGSDKLSELEHGWRNVDKIVNEFGIVCMARSQDHPQEMIDESEYLSSLSYGITLIETPDTFKNISSTQVRKLYFEIQKKTAALNEMIPEELNGLRDLSEKE